MGLFDDLQRSAHKRFEIYLIVLLIWICLLPFGYLLLWKAAKSPVDGGAGCLGILFDIPESREEAQARFRRVNIILLVVIGVIVFGLLMTYITKG